MLLINCTFQPWNMCRRQLFMAKCVPNVPAKLYGCILYSTMHVLHTFTRDILGYATYESFKKNSLLVFNWCSFFPWPKNLNCTIHISTDVPWEYKLFPVRWLQNGICDQEVRTHVWTGTTDKSNHALRISYTGRINVTVHETDLDEE